MSLAMYYNGYFIICIFIGAYIGSFIFTWETISSGWVTLFVFVATVHCIANIAMLQKRDGKQTSVANESTVCCGWCCSLRSGIAYERPPFQTCRLWCSSMFRLTEPFDSFPNSILKHTSLPWFSEFQSLETYRKSESHESAYLAIFLKIRIRTILLT